MNGVPDCPPTYYCSLTLKPPDENPFNWLMFLVIGGLIFLCVAICITLNELRTRRVEMVREEWSTKLRIADIERQTARYNASVAVSRSELRRLDNGDDG